MKKYLSMWSVMKLLITLKRKFWLILKTNQAWGSLCPWEEFVKTLIKVKIILNVGNNACKVVDVVLNPKIVDTMESNPDIMAFTVQIVGNYLLEKYKIAVSEDSKWFSILEMKKVKGLKYKGSKPEVQRVKGKKSPKI